MPHPPDNPPADGDGDITDDRISLFAPEEKYIWDSKPIFVNTARPSKSLAFARSLSNFERGRIMIIITMLRGCHRWASSDKAAHGLLLTLSLFRAD
jgi:hypothetical protein